MLYYTSTSSFPEPSGRENQNPSRESIPGRQFLGDTGNTKTRRLLNKWPGFLMLFLFMLGSQIASAQCITSTSDLNVTECVGEFTFFTVNFSPQATNPDITWQYSTNGGSSWSEIASPPFSFNVFNNFSTAFTRLTISSLSQSFNGYKFRVVLEGSCEQTSSVFTLNMVGPLIIDANDEPEDLTVCETATSAVFSTVATSGGAGTVEYRWQYLNGGTWTFVPNTVLGYSSNVLTLTPAATGIWPNPGTSTTLRVRYRIASCTVEYRTAIFTVDEQPTADAGPATVSICSDALLNLNGIVNDVGLPATWSVLGGQPNDGIADPSALSTIFDPAGYTSPVTLRLRTSTNGECPRASDNIVVTLDELTIDDHDPGNASNAGSRVICDTENTNFNVDYNATITPTLITWEWAIGGGSWAPVSTIPASFATVMQTNSSGQTRIDLTNVSHTFDGALFRVTLVTGATCSVTSDVFQLFVNGPIEITMHPENILNLCDSAEDALFSAEATTGTSGVLEYRWQYYSTMSMSWINVPTDVAGYNTPNLNPTNMATFWPNPGESVELRARISAESCANVFTNPATLSISGDLPAIPDAGPDGHVCEGDNFMLSGASVMPVPPSTGSWTTLGDGGFLDPNFVQTSYVPGPNDITNGSVELVLTTNDPLGVCEVETDTMTLTIHPPTVVTATVDMAAMCYDPAPQFQLDGSVSGTVTTGVWDDGAGGTLGAFVPNNSTLDAIFVPNASAQGITVTLTLTSDMPPVFTNCMQESASVDVTIDFLEITGHIPGAPNYTRSVCDGANTNFRVDYNSSPMNPAAVVWEVNDGGGFVPVVLPSAVYSVTTTTSYTRLDLTAPLVGLDGYQYRAVITAGACMETSEAFTLELFPQASVDAGPDQTVCGNDAATLNGAISGSATSAQWIGGAGVFTPDRFALNATYTPDASEYGMAVTLTLQTDNPVGPCPVATDDVVILVDAIEIDLGADVTPPSFIREICEGNNALFEVDYSPQSPIVPATDSSVVWQYSADGGTTWANVSAIGGVVTQPGSTGGQTHSTRVVIPDVPFSYDNYLIRVRIRHGVCQEFVVFSLQVNPGPTVTVPEDFSVCAGDDIILDGMVDGTATTGTWSVDPGPGAGSFSGVDLFAADATYTPNATEYGTVLTFILETDNPGGVCPAVSETVSVTIDDLTIVSPTTTPATQIFCHGDTGPQFEVRYSSSPTVQTVPIAWEYSTDGGTSWLPVTGPDFVVGPGPDGATFKRTRLDIPVINSDMDGYLFRATFTEGACAPIVSEAFSIQVNGPLTITTQPVDVLEECPTSESVMFEAVADNPSSGTIEYQWRIYTGPNPTPSGNGTAISVSNPDYAGVTTNALTVNNAAFPAPGASAFYKLRLRLDPCLPTDIYSDWVELSVANVTPPGVTLGTPADICSSGVGDLSGLVALTGTATSGTWTTMGDGTFSDPDDVLTAMYTPGPGDISAAVDSGAVGHMVELVFTTNDPANVCPAAVASTFLTIYPETVVDAGEDQSICYEPGDPAPVIQLSGSVSGTVSTGMWSGGSGGISDPNDLNATFTPTLLTHYGSTTTLTLTSTGTALGGCPDPVISTVNITIDTLGITGTSNLNPAGFCETSGSAFFRVSYVSNPDPDPADVQWLVDLGGGFEDVTTATVDVDGTPTPIDYSLNTTATQTRLDINSAPFELNGVEFKAILTSGACMEEGPVFTLTVYEEVTVDAGIYETVCAGDVIALDGMITGGITTGTWSQQSPGPGGTFSPNATTLDATYQPSAADIINGYVTLRLRSDTPADPGACPREDAFVTINIDELTVDTPTPATFVRNVCEGQNTNFSVVYTSNQLGAGVPADVLWEYSADGGATWIDADTGTNPGSGIGTLATPSATPPQYATRLNLMDVPTDYNDYLVRVTLTNGACEETTLFALYVNPGPVIVSTGGDLTICSGDVVNLDGELGGNATTATWSFAGTTRPMYMGTGGTFSDVDIFAASATYTPSAAEYGYVTTLVLTTNNPGGACPAVSETIEITIDDIEITNYTPGGAAAGIRTECAGDDEFFEVDYVSLPGAQNPTWEVSSNGVDWSPATDAAYTVTNTPMVPLATGVANTRLDISPVTNAMNGLMYRAVLPDGECAPVYSEAFTLVVNGPVTITEQPMPIEGLCDNTEFVEFSATASNGGEGTLAYQWQYYNGSTWVDLSESAGVHEGTETENLTVYNMAGSIWPDPGMDVLVRMRVTLASCTAQTTDEVLFSIAANPPQILSISASTPVVANEICEGDTPVLTAVLDLMSATSGTWTSSGDGIFNNPNSTVATYIPGPNDIGNAETMGAAGYDITMTFTTNDPVGNVCPETSDSLTLTLFAAVEVNAGEDIFICKDEIMPGDPVPFIGGATGAVGSVEWTHAGSGLLLSDYNNLTPIYTPTSGNITAGLKEFTLTGFPSSSACTSTSDMMTVYFNDPFTSLSYIPGGGTAGTRTVCNGDDTSFRVDHGATPVTAVQWQYNDGVLGWTDVNDMTNPLTGVANFDVSSLAGGTRLNLNGVTPTVHDYLFRVILTNGGCMETSDVFTLEVNGDIGAITMPEDLVVCESITSWTFTANVAESGNGDLEYQWQYVFMDPMGSYSNVPASGSTGVDSPELTLTAASAAYPSMITPGQNPVFLRLRVSLEGCTTVWSDPIEFRIESAATVQAGVDQFICGKTPTLTGGAFFGGAATSILWTTSGDGTFDDATAVMTVYTPGSLDSLNGSVVLTITTDDPPGAECAAVSDFLTLFIDPEPTVDAGMDMDVCQEDIDPYPNGFVQLNGSIGGAATTGTWMTQGDGFFDNANLLNAKYYPGPGDRANEMVTLELMTDDPGTECGAVMDEKTIFLGPGNIIDTYVPVSRVRTICNGGSATFRVNTNSPTFAEYDWKYSFNGTDWFDDFNTLGFGSYIETEDYLPYTELTLGGGTPIIPNGVLYCQVSVYDRGCLELSEVFTLNVNGPTGWDLQPADLTVCQDDALASFTAVAFNEGAGTITYQWQYNNGGGWTNVPSSIAGYNGTSLFLTSFTSIWPSVGETVDLRLEATLPQCGSIYSEVAVFEVEQCAFTELTTIYAMDGSSFIPGQSRDGVFLIQNIGVDDTNTPVSFVINVPSGTVMTNAIDPMATTANVFGGVSVNNNDWNITPIPIGYLLESKPGVTIPGNGGISVISINFTAVGAPNSQGVIRGFLPTGTAGDVDPGNNSTSVGFIIN